MEATEDDIQRAALKLVYPRVQYVFESYLGGTIAQADRAATQLAALRKEFASLEPAYMRREIMGWIDFYDKRLAETRRDIETGESKKRLEQHSAQIKRDSDRADAVLAKLGLLGRRPPPNLVSELQMPLSRANAWRWIGALALLYVAAGLSGVILFLAWAAFYVFVWPAS